jgi:hypothetical protein
MLSDMIKEKVITYDGFRDPGQSQLSKTRRWQRNVLSQREFRIHCRNSVTLKMEAGF